MVELRKRKAPGEATAPPAKKANSVQSSRKSSTSSKKGQTSTNGSPSVAKINTGDTINLEGFGGEVETQDGVKVSLEQLVNESKKGVVLFTYPKASTPGCTTQACLFRDEFTKLTATGFAIYGLSTDSPKSNTTFKTKQNLPYTLLCDPKATLIAAIGMKKASSGTIRGVFVVNKEGKVEAASPGGPGATVDTVRNLIGVAQPSTSDDVTKMAEAEKAGEAIEQGKTDAQGVEQSHVEQPKATNGDVAMPDAPVTTAPIHEGHSTTAPINEISKPSETKADEPEAEVAAEVADSAQRLDGGMAAEALAATTGDKAKAEVAAEVADSAQKLDGEVEA